MPAATRAENLCKEHRLAFDVAHWLTCVLTGRHAYTPWCGDGSMFLRCTNCGHRRGGGWAIAGKPGDETSSVEWRPDRRPAPHVSILPVANSD